MYYIRHTIYHTLYIACYGLLFDGSGFEPQCSTDLGKFVHRATSPIDEYRTYHGAEAALVGLLSGRAQAWTRPALRPAPVPGLGLGLSPGPGARGPWAPAPALGPVHLGLGPWDLGPRALRPRALGLGPRDPGARVPKIRNRIFRRPIAPS